MSGKVVYAFNNYFYDFIKDLKQFCKGNDLYKTIKENYTVKNMPTEDNMAYLMDQLNDKNIVQSIINDDNWEENTELGAIKIVKDVSIEDICKVENYDNFRNVFVSYFLLFVVLGLLHKDMNDDDAASILHILGQCQNGDPDVDFESILNEDIKQIMQLIHSSNVSEEPKPLNEILENSEIGNLAKEIAEDIDIEGLNIKDPMDLFKGENSKLIGDIVSKVSSKFNSGELKQDKMMSEAMQFMNTMGNNDMFKNIMSSMAGMQGMPGMPPSGSHNAAGARARLSKKYASKK